MRIEKWTIDRVIVKAPADEKEKALVYAADRALVGYEMKSHRLDLDGSSVTVLERKHLAMEDAE